MVECGKSRDGSKLNETALFHGIDTTMCHKIGL